MKPQLVAAGACAGLGLANAARVGPLTVGVACVLLFAATPRLVFLTLAVALFAWWWGSWRLDHLDASALAPHVGEAGRARVVVTGPARAGSFSLRIPGVVDRFAEEELHEPTLLELAKGRAPPQGAVLSVLAVVNPPRAAADGFDERTWLRRRGVHAVLRVDEWHVIGRRGGIGGIADAVRRRLSRSITRGLAGERGAVVAGVVLGDEQRISARLRDRFRASGLYHLLAVSGQNVVLFAAGVIVSAWVLGVSRVIAELVALGAIAAYVLAVGAQPSVVRAGVAGGLCSLAWLTARAADRWHVLLVGAIALLAWNPYTLFDVGFQLSFAAVVAIFVLVPRFQEFFEGYPLGVLRPLVAVSAACGVATAPILWLQFHSLQVLAIPANALAAPAIVPLLGLAFAAAAVAPVSGSAATALTWLNGWCAAYLAAVARMIGGLPFAQIQSTRTLLLILAGAFVVAAYAAPRWPTSSPST